ncbi:unnamed protein product [Polarella glacialis]|uniref:Uncharacterized protein n=1 Tax=Polarella glacialis TaxID=89957 RepID=A0A813K018_POLGL|nr:unnamed protein product [Polarella glacialis]
MVVLQHWKRLPQLWLIASLLLALAQSSPPQPSSATCQDVRPPVAQRTFRSEAVDKAIEDIAGRMTDGNLACLFRNTLPSCLDTTVYSFKPAGVSKPQGSCSSTPGLCKLDSDDKDDTFIVTGDINAMWLRDSTNQVLPYMRYAKEDPHLQQLLRGLVNRQVRQIQTDVFANAHNIDRSTGQNPNSYDKTTKPGPGGIPVNAMNPLIYERKYELDSLCAFLKLGSEYYAGTADSTPFDSDWVKAVQLVLSTMRSMQSATQRTDASGYFFQRCTSCEPGDTLSHGVGFPGAFTGLVRSSFRPSDDATQLPFLVPANAMAVVELRRAARVFRETAAARAPTVELSAGGESLAVDLEVLASEIDAALQREAVVPHRKAAGGESVFAYEVDGFGNTLHMDDANVPSLLSLPYLGYIGSDNSTYLSTRRMVLNRTTNPFYFEGSAGRGVGSPHTGIGRIWPMSIIMQALTSESDEEISSCLHMLATTTAWTWFMHESFNKDDAAEFSRPWFSWANSLFGELILRLSEERPHLIFRTAGKDQPLL